MSGINNFSRLLDCVNCYDQGLIMKNEFVTDFCNDCEKGTELELAYTLWYSENELNEYSLENA